MRFRPAVLAFVAVLLAAAGIAQAGYKYLIPVVVNDTSRFAYGSLDGALRSADGIQYIGCNRSATNVYCFATNDAGLQRACSTTDPNMIAVVRAMSNKAYLYFTWDTGGNCTSISTAELSYSQN